MNRGHFWKFLLTVFILAWSFASIYPPSGRDMFGVFLENSYKQDGVFTNIVTHYRDLQKKNPERIYGNLRLAIGSNDITKYFPDFDVKAEKDPTLYILNRLQREASGKIKLGLDLIGGSSFVVQMKTDKLESNKVDRTVIDLALDNAIEVLRKRVDKYGVAEPLIQKVPGQNRIIIQMPGLSQDVMDSVRTAIQKAAVLEFRMVHEDNANLIKEGVVPPGHEIKKEVRTARDGKKELIPVVVEKRPVPGLSGKNVVHAGVIRDNFNNPEISFQFDTAGASIFGDLTRKNVGRQMAILLDGELYSAPVIRSEIPNGSGVIQGTFEEKEAFDLANVLQNPLETPVEIISESTVDPSLGRDSISSGLNASYIAAIGTFLFMLVFYFFSGLVANLALVMNILILMGVMCAMKATLTLPGIAGIALTIGMAVDANVLIFERMREELAAGKSLRGALVGGYGKAFTTIFDSNLTTVISAVILIYMGTGPVKGFGITLTIGVCASMFTALLVTRLIFDFLTTRGLIKSVPMLPMFKDTHFDFLRWGRVALITTSVLAVVGLGYGVVRGKKSLGVDFAGGDSMTFAFTQKVDVDKLRASVNKAGATDSLIQYQKPIAGGHETLQILVPFGSGTKVASALTNDFPKAGFEVGGVETVGASVGKEIQRSAVIASLLALFGILIYVAFRYELSFAVGAVVAVLHDVVLSLGLFFMMGGQLSATVVAAVLTIIGYSINDKIVNLDRIREDLKLGVRGTFRELINLALNQTLGRTVITGGSVILSTLALYFVGGGVIEDFAFVFLVGTVAGTYSSIFIASPIVLWWNKGQRPAIGSNVNMGNAPSVPAKA
ncbi:MAG: protein translocase subunit SecD [Verrucomicrobia bacterium]|nr:protein translocase subunit SecD [Verrucomicrobiota bacterium]